MNPTCLTRLDRFRRERRAKVYAEALAAMRRFQEVPYKVWRRPASDAKTRAEIGQEHSDATAGVAYHQVLLRMDSEVVGAAYWDLWSQVRVTRKANRVLAWKSPVITSDEAMAENPPFERDDADVELELCLLAMRREMSLLGPLLRRDTRRRLQYQRAVRGRAT